MGLNVNKTQTPAHRRSQDCESLSVSSQYGRNVATGRHERVNAEREPGGFPLRFLSGRPTTSGPGASINYMR